MDNIDDLMRQKFDSDDPGARFEFREEYWEQAQALLEQDEERRRKGLLWLWWILGALLLISIGLWCMRPQGIFGEVQKYNVEEKEAPSSALSIRNSSEMPENRAQITVKPQESDLRTVVRASSMDKKEDNGESESHSVARSTLKSKRRAAAIVKQQNLTRERRQKEDDQVSIKSGIVALGAPENQDKKSEVEKGGGSGISNVQYPMSNIQIESSNDQNSISKTQYSIFNLPTPLRALILPKVLPVLKPLPVPKTEPIAKLTDPAKDSRFSLGLQLAGAAYPASDSLGRRAGWTIGAFGVYKWKPDWSLRLGAQVRFIPGYQAVADSTHPVLVEQLRYSFGYSKEVYTRQTKGLHLLELPLAVQWNKGAWGLEAGAAAGMLLLVQDRTSLTKESSLEPANSVVKKFVRGDFAPYNKVYGSAFVGAEYRFAKRFAVMARAQYRFTPVFKNTQEVASNNGLGNVECGVRVRLF